MDTTNQKTKIDPEFRITGGSGSGFSGFDSTSTHGNNRRRMKFNRQKSSLMKKLPSIITIAALCFGLSAIKFGLFHKWELAVACVIISAFLDSMDGRVARMIGQSSQFGAELDSLSDLVCFGVAPAILMFLSGLYSVESFGWAVCMFFAICCALRLARFNAVLILNEPQPSWSKKYFTGVPAPAGAVIALFPLILYFATDNVAFLNCIFVSICVVFSGLMMISRVKSFSSKMIEFKDGFASPELVVITLVIISVITAPWITMSCLTALYVLMIPFGAYRYRQQKLAIANAAGDEEETVGVEEEEEEEVPAESEEKEAVENASEETAEISEEEDSNSHNKLPENKTFE